MDATRSAPQGAHCQADVIGLLPDWGFALLRVRPTPARFPTNTLAFYTKCATPVGHLLLFCYFTQNAPQTI